VRTFCRIGGRNHIGTEVAGDIAVIPNGHPSFWDMKDEATALIVRLKPAVLRAVAEDLGIDPERVELLDRFKLRDPQIEHLAWALHAEVESGYSSGGLYFDSLATALAVRLVRNHSSAAALTRVPQSGDIRIREVLSYIDANLGQDLSLARLAGVARVS